MKAKAAPEAIDAYIAACPPEVQAILQKIRATIKKAAPEAVERISYQMPAFTFHGRTVYVGAFKKHIGFYPPVNEPELVEDVAPYAGEKGNLRFPLDAPVPYRLITKIIQTRVRAGKAAAETKKVKKK